MSAPRIKFGVVLVGLVVLLLGGAIYCRLGDRPARAEGAKDSKVRRLLKERLAVLEKIAAGTEERFNGPFGGRISVKDLYEAKRAVLQAKLELCDSDKERIAILEKLVVVAREYEDKMSEQVKAGHLTD